MPDFRRLRRPHALEELAQHAQAAAVVASVEILRLGDTPPAALPAGGRPLAGIHVMDVNPVLAGRTGTRPSLSMARMFSNSPRRTRPIPAQLNWTPASASCPACGSAEPQVRD